MKYGLALHTSSPALGLAIGSSANDVRVQTWDLGRGTSDLLHPYLLEFLQAQGWQDVAWIAAANGPGGFTGTRLGMVTARTLGQQLDVPVFAISSLAAIAWQLGQTGKIAVSMPAGRDEIFGAIYECVGGAAVMQDRERKLTAIVADTAVGSADWERQLAESKPDLHHVVAASANLADTVAGVFGLAQMAYAAGDRPQWTMALPFYGQNPVTLIRNS